MKFVMPALCGHPVAEMKTYRCRLDRCDVVDKERLKKYRKLRKKWLHLLFHDEYSVLNQLTSMTWDDAAFRVVNKSWGIAAEYEEKHACQNDLIAGLIERGYVATQVLAIRKLVEEGRYKGGKPKKPDKQIISLSRLIDEIIENRELLTREIYVCHDGLSYDYLDARNEFYKKVWEMRLNGNSFEGNLPSKGRKAWGASLRHHQAFDRLAGVEPNRRKRDDLIKKEKLEKIRKSLDTKEVRKVRNLANKQIAHAADNYSRRKHRGLKGVSLNEIQACQKALYSVAVTISGTILFESSFGPLAIPQFSIFKGLDKPWIKKYDLKQLREAWNEHEKELYEWSGTLMG